MDLEQGILTIQQVSIIDAGTYACVANTTGQDLVISAPAYLRVTSKYMDNQFWLIMSLVLPL